MRLTRTNRSGAVSPVPASIQTLLALVLGALVLLGAWWMIGRAVETAPASFEDAFDEPVLEYAIDQRSPWLTTAMRATTRLGGTLEVIVLLVVAMIGSFAMTRRARWPIFFAVAVVALQLSHVLKALVDRDRPALDPLYEISSQAWPSGHATGAAAAFGALGYFLFRMLPTPWSTLGAVLCGVVVVVVGVTRVYLGVHWPTDVLGGWALGLAWVGIVVWATRPLAAGRMPR